MSSALSSPRQMSHTETKQDLFFLVHPDVLFSVPKIRICIRECLNPLEGQPFFFMPQEGGGSFVAVMGDIAPALALGSFCTLTALPWQKERKEKICHKGMSEGKHSGIAQT